MKSNFILCTEKLPEMGKLLVIKLPDGTELTAWRTDSSFDEELGYLYEDINCEDHYQKDVVAWKYK